VKKFDIESVRRTPFQLASQPKPFPGKWPTRLYWRVGEEEYFGKPNASQVSRYQALVQEASAFRTNARVVELDRSGAIYIADEDGARTGTLFGFYYHWQRADAQAGHLCVPLYRKRIAGYTVLSPYATLKADYVEDWRRYANDVLGGKLRPARPQKVIATKRTGFTAADIEAAVQRARPRPVSGNTLFSGNTLSSFDAADPFDRPPFPTTPATAGPTPIWNPSPQERSTLRRRPNG
jgi:hypothetical protein